MATLLNMNANYNNKPIYYPNNIFVTNHVYKLQYFINYC
jgi:hypothetical protein